MFPMVFITFWPLFLADKVVVFSHINFIRHCGRIQNIKDDPLRGQPPSWHHAGFWAFSLFFCPLIPGGVVGSGGVGS
jgi:hypothetical protein